jgi:hypothetical protein
VLLSLLLAGCAKKPKPESQDPLATTPEATPVPAEVRPPTGPNTPSTSSNDDTRLPTDPPTKASLTFADLKKAYVGKTKEEFRQRFGKPESIQADGADEYWYYTGLTIDPATKEPEEIQVQVSIKNGVIQRFNR